MIGLALEGGGAKGAFQIGAYRALTELGYRFDAVTGCSIGAINAAIIAQGDWENAAEFWSTITNDDLFLEKDSGFVDLINRQVDLDTLTILRENVKEALKTGGIDTSGIRRFLQGSIDPKKLLASETDFGIVALSFPELQPLMAFKEDMTEENLIDHVLASATFPGFQQTAIGDKKYLDGGFYDACPYNMLFDRGCDTVIALRLKGFGIIHPPRDKDNLISVFPSDSLGPVLNFEPKQSLRNMEMGYFDTMRVFRKLGGRRYYFTGSADGFAAFAALDADAIRCAMQPLRLPDELHPRRALFEHILPAVAEEMKLPKGTDYDTLLLALLEERAARLKIERLRYYTPAELQALCQKEPLTACERPLLLARPEEAIDALVQALPALG